MARFAKSFPFSPLAYSSQQLHLEYSRTPTCSRRALRSACSSPPASSVPGPINCWGRSKALAARCAATHAPPGLGGGGLAGHASAAVGGHGGRLHLAVARVELDSVGHQTARQLLGQRRALEARGGDVQSHGKLVREQQACARGLGSGQGGYASRRVCQRAEAMCEEEREARAVHVEVGEQPDVVNLVARQRRLPAAGTGAQRGAASPLPPRRTPSQRRRPPASARLAAPRSGRGTGSGTA